MKKIILMTIATLYLAFTYAQQGNRGGGIREQLAELDAIADEKVLDEKLKGLLSSTNEQDNLLVYYYYASKEQTEKADQIKEQIVQKFPEGQFVFQERLQQITALTDLDEKDKQFMALYKENSEGGYGFVAFNMAQEFAARGDEDKMKFYADIYGTNVTDGRGNRIPIERVYASVAGPMVRSNPDVAAKYLEKGVEYAKASVDEMLAASDAPNENLLLRAKNNYYSALTSYVGALSQGSNPESGYQLISEIFNDLKKESQDQNGLAFIEGTYLQTLLKTNRYKEALPLLEKAIIAGGMSEDREDNLKRAYIAVKGSDDGFMTYLEELLAAQTDKLKDEVAKMAINELSHDFTLQDVDGNTVSLSDLQGKVVVLDFWATWCGPCKASFPAMQKAVNKYEDDEDVRFLFIHTWDRAKEPIKDAKDYVVDNNYTFEVLMDLRDTETNESKVAKDYGVRGIPTKIIIDPKGQIRFNTSGFSADEEKAVRELSAMIEFARKG